MGLDCDHETGYSFDPQFCHSDLQIASYMYCSCPRGRNEEDFCHQSKTRRWWCVGGKILGCTLRALEGIGVWGAVGGGGR